MNQGENTGVGQKSMDASKDTSPLSEHIRLEVVSPKHYNVTQTETIEFCRHYPFDLGNVFKYVSRAGAKNSDTLLVDLEKAVWYLKDYMMTPLPNLRKIGIDQEFVNYLADIRTYYLDTGEERVDILASLAEYMSTNNAKFLDKALKILENLVIALYK